jgi:hypothetical protein
VTIAVAVESAMVSSWTTCSPSATAMKAGVDWYTSEGIKRSVMGSTNLFDGSYVKMLTPLKLYLN